MKVFKHTELAELPEFATEGSACFDLKACFAPMEFLKSYNAWNKEAPIVAKERVDGVHAHQDSTRTTSIDPHWIDIRHSEGSCP